MNDFISKFLDVEKNISKDRGKFALFGLFQHESPEDKWDVVVAAPWLDKNDKNDWVYITNKIESTLGPGGLLKLSKAALLDTKDRFVRAVNSAFKVEHKPVEIWNTSFDDIRVYHGYIITSKRPNT